MNTSDKTLLAVVFVVVLLMTLGQLLFKATALSWHQHATLFAPPVAWRLFVALSVYGLATMAWIWVLQRAPLTLAYPVVALTFVLVPLGARWQFGEVVGFRYLLGTGLIILGIVVATSSRPAT